MIPTSRRAYCLLLHSETDLRHASSYVIPSFPVRKSAVILAMSQRQVALAVRQDASTFSAKRLSPRYSRSASKPTSLVFPHPRTSPAKIPPRSAAPSPSSRAAAPGRAPQTVQAAQHISRGQGNASEEFTRDCMGPYGIICQ